MSARETIICMYPKIKALAEKHGGSANINIYWARIAVYPADYPAVGSGFEIAETEDGIEIISEGSGCKDVYAPYSLDAVVTILTEAEARPAPPPDECDCGDLVPSHEWDSHECYATRE